MALEDKPNGSYDWFLIKTQHFLLAKSLLIRVHENINNAM